MATSVYPDKYLSLNSEQTKTPAIAVEIPGIDLLTNTPLYVKVRYGDPGIVYGLPNIVYGGLRPLAGVRDLLSLDASSLTIGQKVEPEQGRSSVSILSLGFIDQNNYMSQVISPGVLIPEILGSKVRVYMGFSNSSFPDDYFTIFRGYITGVTSSAGIVTLQLSDPNIKRRQQVFDVVSTTLVFGVNSSATTIPVFSTSAFYDQITGPDGVVDTSVKTYIKIDDEYMQYGFGDLSSSSLTVTRGARGTTAASHNATTTVDNQIELTGTAMDLALKIMLSGWNGPYLDSIALHSIRSTGSSIMGDQPQAIILDLKKNAVEDYGLVIGDWVDITGSSAGNDGHYQITQIADWEDLKNRILYVNHTFNPEATTLATASFRSQFDTLPIISGMKLDPNDVDVKSHVELKSDFFGNDFYQFFQQSPINGKSFLEQEIYLPEGAYAITKFGRLSVNVTKPAIADVSLQILNKDNILNPDSIVVTRSVNNRRFFNDIRYSYDVDDSGNYLSLFDLEDFDSLNVIGISSTLPIQSNGLRSSLGGDVIATRRGQFLLTRYKNAAFEIGFKVNWQVGSLIETGDAVIVQDNGDLQITNINTGVRDIGTQIFEVIDRKLDIKSGNVTLQLLSGLGFDVSDRYGTIAPSSYIAAGSTSSRVTIKESFGALFPNKEQLKWSDYVGLNVTVHNYSFTHESTTILTGFDPGADHVMILDPPLSYTPSENDIVEINLYPTSTDPTVDEIYKIVHAHVDPTVLVTSGVSGTQFHVSSGDAFKFQVGLPILIHNDPYTVDSPECIVLSVVGTLVTLSTDLGFTPVATQLIELIGFADGGGAYRIL